MVIPTDEFGNVTALQSVLNHAIRDVAGRVLDVTVKDFRLHSQMSFEMIEHDINSRFAFNPPRRDGYIKSYLQESLSWCRYQWRCYWKKNHARHPQCPQKRYHALVAQWSSEAADERVSECGR